jgi:hypothetical protein
MDAIGAADSGLSVGLRQYAADRFSGVLRVDGQPGGAIHLVDGGISACQTSGAPSLEVILLRSGRVAESDWNAAFTEAAIAGRPMTAELVERGLLGAGEVEALLRIALADAMFAVTCGRVDSWTETPAADHLLPLDPAARAGWLLAEATRRRQVLASFPAPLVSAADRIAVAPASVLPGRVLGHGQDEILALVDGRRTPRDLAFALGQGLYETMLELTRMRAGNTVVISSRGQAHAPSEPASPPSGGQERDETTGGLPRRRRDRDRAGSGRAGETGRRSFAANIRMLRPRSEGGELPGDTS